MEKNKMSVEELKDYMTVAQKNKILLYEYQTKGLFMKTAHYWRTTPMGEFVIFETTIYGRNSKGEECVMANGSAAENISTNSNRTVDPFRFCETSSRGRALAVLGIGLKEGMSSRDDLSCGIDYTGPEKVEDVSKPKSSVKPPSIEATVKRLKLKYEVTDKTFVVEAKGIQKKTLSVLSRYGFTEVDGKLICERDDV